MILVDYKCSTCGVRVEHVVSHPIPGQQICRCEGTMTRRYSFGGLTGTAEGPSATADLSCAANRTIPGFCHFGAAARRRAHAAWTGDDKTYESELRKQTRRFEQAGPPSLSEVVAHVHETGDGATQVGPVQRSSQVASVTN